ncbi:MAG: FIG00688197: hypothetical protein, partial [uncultured Acetobacteraceae bacterium]
GGGKLGLAAPARPGGVRRGAAGRRRLRRAEGVPPPLGRRHPGGDGGAAGERDVDRGGLDRGRLPGADDLRQARRHLRRAPGLLAEDHARLLLRLLARAQPRLRGGIRRGRALPPVFRLGADPARDRQGGGLHLPHLRPGRHGARRAGAAGGAGGRALVRRALAALGAAAAGGAALGHRRRLHRAEPLRAARARLQIRHRPPRAAHGAGPDDARHRGRGGDGGHLLRPAPPRGGPDLPALRGHLPRRLRRRHSGARAGGPGRVRRRHHARARALHAGGGGGGRAAGVPPLLLHRAALRRRLPVRRLRGRPAPRRPGALHRHRARDGGAGGAGHGLAGGAGRGAAALHGRAAGARHRRRGLGRSVGRRRVALRSLGGGVAAAGHGLRPDQAPLHRLGGRAAAAAERRRHRLAARRELVALGLLAGAGGAAGLPAERLLPRRPPDARAALRPGAGAAGRRRRVRHLPGAGRVQRRAVLGGELVGGRAVARRAQLAPLHGRPHRRAAAGRHGAAAAPRAPRGGGLGRRGAAAAALARRTGARPGRRRRVR